jgi:hypothetical protein
MNRHQSRVVQSRRGGFTPDNEAQLGMLVAGLFRENGWKVLHQAREQTDLAP